MNPNNTLIHPDIKEGQFVANGKTYRLEKQISIARKIESDKLIAEIATGGSVGSLFNDLKKLYELCNQQKFADIAVTLHNKMNVLKGWNERQDPVLALCALYINEVNEDRRTITDERIKQKIADWMEAGIEYGFFLIMAKALLKQLAESWQENSHIDLEEANGPIKNEG